jgi:hypothetical protein
MEKPARGGGIAFPAMVATPGFERNARMALKQPETLQPGLKEVLERYLADPLKATTEDMQQLLDQRAQFRGRPRPESAATAHIRQLVAEHPTLKPRSLRKLADESIIGSMDKGTFRNKVAAARRK